MSAFWLYFKLGYNHVLDWNAYDHVLFLIVLTVAYTVYDWKRVLWLVTVFTVGHTLSLTLSVYDVVNISVPPIEFLILVTILVTAVYNVITAGRNRKKGKPGPIFFITLFFGAIHGLGFSNYFKQIVAVEDNKLIPLLEFALGIETAQAVIVVLILILGFIFQAVLGVNKRDWIIVISAVVTGAILPMIMPALLNLF